MVLDIVTKCRIKLKRVIYSRILWIVILNLVLIIVPIIGLNYIRSRDYREVTLRGMSSTNLNRKIAENSESGISPDVIGLFPGVAPYQRVIIVEPETLAAVYDSGWLRNSYIISFEYDLLLTRIISDLIGNYSVYPKLKKDEIINRMSKYIKPGINIKSIIDYRFVYSIKNFTIQDGSRFSSIVIMDKSDIVKNSKVSKILLLFITALSALIAIVISLIYYKLIIKPLTILTKEAELIKDLEKIPPGIFSMKDREDEIGHLAKAFYSSSRELIRRKESIEIFTGDVLHELKNPLTGIRNGIELIQNNKHTNSEDMLSIISRESGRIEKLLFDIREYSLFDKSSNRDHKCSPSEIIKNIITLYSQSEIKLKIVESNEKINISEDMLISILTNLIDNALDFSPDKGSVTVSFYTLESISYLKIDDLGPGIPDIEKKRIFDRFYTNRKPEHSKSIHSGLGLSIIKKILDKNDNSITCKDNNPTGTSFIIKFRNSALS